MVIAINTISLFSENKERNFIYEIFNRIIKSHPEHTFLFIFGEETSSSLLISENVKALNTGPVPKNLLGIKLWFRFKIINILKEYHAGFYISLEVGLVRIKLPQVLFTPDLSYIFQPDASIKRRQKYLKKKMRKFLNKARPVIVNSLFEKGVIEKKHPGTSAKTVVVYEGADENIQPINFEERESLKEKFADGNEYFIYSGTISRGKNLMNLLKAFSVFRKRQRSGMQLIISGNKGKGFDEFAKTLELYKFKKEVKLLPGLPSAENKKLIAASYAMTLPSSETLASASLYAMQYGVPVISSPGTVVAETCMDAALYFDPNNFKDISEKMMQIFKDEMLRKELIVIGKARVKKYNWDESAKLAWKNVEETFLTHIAANRI